MALMVPFGVSMTGPEVGPLLVRGTGAIGGALAVSVTLVEVRRSQRPSPGRYASTPWWGFAGGYLVLAATAVRILPYLSSVLDGWRDGVGFRVFVVLLIMSGTVLPMALVHRWGRIWPRWAWPLAGRAVPRWLVLGPGMFMGAGLVVYFGGGGFGALITGVQPSGFHVIVMIGAYTGCGIGLLVASASYAHLTRTSGRESSTTVSQCLFVLPCSSGSHCSQCRSGSSSTTGPASSASPRP